MAELIVTFTLVKAAKGKGGDRYSHTFDNGYEWTIYLPQFLTREDGYPKDQIVVTVV